MNHVVGAVSRNLHRQLVAKCFAPINHGTVPVMIARAGLFTSLEESSPTANRRQRARPTAQADGLLWNPQVPPNPSAKAVLEPPQEYPRILPPSRNFSDTPGLALGTAGQARVRPACGAHGLPTGETG